MCVCVGGGFFCWGGVVSGCPPPPPTPSPPGLRFLANCCDLLSGEILIIPGLPSHLLVIPEFSRGIYIYGFNSVRADLLVNHGSLSRNSRWRIAFPPHPWGMARITEDWRPVTDSVSELDIPATDDFAPSPWNIAPTRNSRIDFSDSIAWRYRRVWGLVVLIEETQAGNTSTPFRSDITVRINFDRMAIRSRR